MSLTDCLWGKARNAIFVIVPLALLASACETEGEPDPGGNIEAEQEALLSDTEDAKIKLSAGDTMAKITFKAGSGPSGTKVKGRLVSSVMKAGGMPAGGKVIQILPSNLMLTAPATLVMSADPPGPGVKVKSITAAESDSAWTVGGEVQMVDPAELSFGGGLKVAYSIPVSQPGLWGLIFEGGLVPDGGADGPAGDGPASDGGGNVVRTIAYHQIATPIGNPTSPPVISANGAKIAFAIAPGTGDPKDPNRIYTINPDGTGLKEVDAYTSLCYCGAFLSISDDGKVVASTDAVQLRVVGAEGSGLIGSLTTVSNEIWKRPLLNGDGTRVFFVNGRDNAVAGMSMMPLQRGIWAMNANGSGLTQLGDPDTLGPMMGAKPDDVFPFRICGESLAVSSDGKHVAFSAPVGGKGDVVWGINGDGTGLHVINGPLAPAPGYSLAMFRISMSGDGNTVIYRGLKDPTMSFGDTEILAISFDGASKKKFIDAPPTSIGGGCDSTLQPTTDGSRVLIGETGVIVPVAGGDAVSLHMPSGFYSGDPYMLGEGCCSVYPYFSMSADGKRAVFQHIEGPSKPAVISLLEVDPPSLGAAPSVSMATLSLASIPRDRSMSSTVSAKATGTGIYRVGTVVSVHGVWDSAGSWLSGQLVLLDDGKAPDTMAGDGVYTATGISAGTGAEVGPRLVRIKAESRAADGKMHATAIDVSGLSVK